MRVFEHNEWRVTFEPIESFGTATHRGEPSDSVFSLWYVLEHGWREVPPFDITKLDTVGVFHAEPAKATDELTQLRDRLRRSEAECSMLERAVEEAGRLRREAECLAEARLRTIHGLNMRLKLENPKRHGEKS